jgi:hypothetical protein
LSFLDGWKRYYLYNNLLVRTIFDGRFADTPLYLDIDGAIADDLIGELGSDIEAFKSALATAVAGSLELSERDPFARHRDQRERWERGGRVTPPPFIGLLTALSIAAEKMVRDDQFEASNYYQRLFKYLHVFDPSHQQKIRSHFRETAACWEALDRWLFDTQFELGRPTAQQINGFPYVSYAISQALIRDAERLNLRMMFADTSLAPGETLTPEEMQLYLERWISGTHSTPWLRKMWTKPDLRARVILAACEELVCWNGAGSTRTEGGGQVYTLSWTCGVSGFPSRFSLYLTLSELAAKGVGDIDPSSCRSKNGRALLSSATGTLAFTALENTSFASLEPRNKIVASELLQENFELTNSTKSVQLRKTPRSIIPFAKLDTGVLYKEVSHLALLQEHFILCHKNWTARLRDALTQAARPGFREYSAKQLRGMPEDWSGFGLVTLVRVLKDQPNDIQSILPHEQTVIELQHGIRLFEDTWHSGAPPEILAAAGKAPLRITYEQSHPEADWKARTQDSTEPFIRLDLKAYSPPAGSYGNIKVYHGGAKLKELRICFGSADFPRRLTLLSVRELASSISPTAPASLYSADMKSEAPTKGISVSGMILSGEPADAVDQEKRVSVPTEVVSYDEEDEAEDAGFLTAAPVAAAETCVISYHHWHCESFNPGDNPRAPKWMECSACGQKFLTRNRGKRPISQSVLAKEEPQLPPKSMARTEPSIGPDTIFDALCYLGGSRWPRFAEIVSSASCEPYFVSNLAARLSALGHIDIRSKGVGFSPFEWRCAPPAVVMRSDGTAFLAGFRSNKLVSDLDALVQDAGGFIERVTQDAAPTACLINGLAEDRIAKICSALRDPHGRVLQFVSAPGSCIAHNAPMLDSIRSELQDVYLSGANAIENYNPNSNKWFVVSSTVSPGAYRSNGCSRFYAVRFPDGALKRAPFRLAKIFGGKLAGVRLFGYRPESKEFIVALGCEPPPLLERALVSCSGLLPRRTRGRLIYANVDDAVANAVLQKLYG